MFLEMRGWKHSFDLVPMLQRGNRLKYLIEFIEIAAGATRSALPRGSMGTRNEKREKTTLLTNLFIFGILKP
jgi:hypothetical protein